MLTKPRFYGTFIVAALLVASFFLHLAPGAFAGILALAFAHALRGKLEPYMQNHVAKIVGTSIIIGIVVITLTGIGVGLHGFFKQDGGYHKMLGAISEQVETVRTQLPASVSENLPEGAAEMSEKVSEWLKEHSSDAAHAGKAGASTFAHVLIGIIIALLGFWSAPLEKDEKDPFVHELSGSFRKLVQTFGDVFGAQILISALNTALTAIYLFIALPIAGTDFGVHKWTLIVLTFLFGMIPVVGNLMSNVAIIGVSVIFSLKVAVASLIFLIVVHKLEYFANAKIIGSRISAKPWELLLWMVFMESAFGIPGVLFAPVLCAWTKREFRVLRGDAK